MRAVFLSLTLSLLAPAVAVASDAHGAPAKPAAATKPAPAAPQAAAGHGPVTAALPGKPVTGSAPVAASSHGASPARTSASPAAPAGAHGAPASPAAGSHAAATPVVPVHGKPAVPVGGHGGAPPAPGPVDGRGPDRGRTVVRLTSGRAGARTRRVAVVWPEPTRLKLRWDEPAERVALVWPKDE